MNDTDLVRLCYVSEASFAQGDDYAEQIDAILNRPRWWNESAGITGACFLIARSSHRCWKGRTGSWKSCSSTSGSIRGTVK